MFSNSFRNNNTSIIINFYLLINTLSNYKEFALQKEGEIPIIET